MAVALKRALEPLASIPEADVLITRQYAASLNVHVDPNATAQKTPPLGTPPLQPCPGVVNQAMSHESS